MAFCVSRIRRAEVAWLAKSGSALPTTRFDGMADETRLRARWARGYSLGTEFAAAIAGFSLLGYWLDRYFGTKPRATLICFSLGLIGGTYNFVRSSIKQYRESSAEDAVDPKIEAKSPPESGESPPE